MWSSEHHGQTSSVHVQREQHKCAAQQARACTPTTLTVATSRQDCKRSCCVYEDRLRRDVRRGLILSQKMHRSVTPEILQRDMFVRCHTKNNGKITYADGYRFCTTRDKKEPRSTMALDRRWFLS